MSSGFYLIPAHSIATLAEELATQIKNRPTPFQPETVLIMNYAQRIWLQRFLAERLGICANLQFKSPEKFLEDCLLKNGKNTFERNALSWRIFEILKKINDKIDSNTEPLRFNLYGKSEIDFFQCAGEIGDLFWRYQSFRPQMIRDWTNDNPEPQTSDINFLHEYRRQKNLWKNLNFDNEIPPAIAWLNFLENKKTIEDLPARIFAFAPSALPRIHLALLEKLSENTEVFLFYHNLSHDLWTETNDSKKRLRERSSKERSLPLIFRESFTEDFFYETAGNELLTAWGKAARPLAMHFIDAGLLGADSNRDTPPERDSILHALQREIRDNSPTPQKFIPAENDRSLHIAIAPNPLREMEILRDELTAKFAKDPNLKPRDILVMLADLETYTPFIQGIFEGSDIPFSIADRSGTELFPSAFALLEIIRIAQGEFQINAVLSLLDLEIIRNSLGFCEEETNALREILTEAGIRWGLDKKFRREHIFGDKIQESEHHDAAELLTGNNSWEFGLRRLALGFMCGSEDEEVFDFAGKSWPSSVPNLTETAPDALGKIVRLVLILSELHRAFSLKVSKSVPIWCDFLQTLLIDEFLDTENGETGILRKTLREISQAATNETECLFETLCEALKKQDWSSSNMTNGMLRGKVTFCKMQPMRNIPAKMICIAGLSDGAFPRNTSHSRMDLLFFRTSKTLNETTLWDRSQRDDDCLLFLESILAAQETLFLSYVGRCAGDGQSVPPCIPLAKLRDFLLEIVSVDSDTPGSPFFETLHCLHGFSSLYFSEKETSSQKFFSFDRANYATLLSSNASEKPPNTDFHKHLPPSSVPSEISTNDLSFFFKSSATFICKKWLGINWSSKTAPSNEDPQLPLPAFETSRFHRVLFEKYATTLTDNPLASTTFSLKKELSEFYKRELSAGRAPAFIEPNTFEDSLFSKLKDFPEISSFFPTKLFRIPVEEIPSTLSFSEFYPPLKISLNFENLCRDDKGDLFLALTGKAKFDWRVAVETFISAQILSAAFPKQAFTVSYFLYDEKSPKVISDKTLSLAELSMETLLRFYEKRSPHLPFFFEKIPIAATNMDEDTFFAQVQIAWENKELNACDIFIFGENAPALFEKHIREEIFPCVQQICSAFAPPPSKK